VLEAGNGEEAWRILHEDGTGVDLVLTDIVMPRMGGHELARRLEASHPELPVLFMSGYSDETTINPALAGRLVTKPFSPRELTDAVRSALDVPQGQLNASRTGGR
jgi:CheY-like chemotaxis protein